MFVVDLFIAGQDIVRSLGNRKRYNNGKKDWTIPLMEVGCFDNAGVRSSFFKESLKIHKTMITL